MNIYSYIDKYSHLSFNEEEFNEIDNIIFSSLSYIDLEKYISHNSFNKRTLKKIGDKYFEDHLKKEKYPLATKNAVKVLNNIKDTNRYKDLLLYNYTYIGDNEQQFSALTIEINKKLVYVSYEGTDTLISGWREDFMMSYMFPIKSQKQAINYINKRFIFNNKKIILGGHSKGGNLAIVSGMHANYLIQRRIIHIYNNDGPGLKSKEINSKNYQNIKEKLIHIVPNYSIFGLLLRHDKDYKVIKSTKKSIFAHDFATWVVEKNKFKDSELSTMSKAIEKSGEKWLNQFDDTERQKFVNALFNIFNQLNIINLNDIYNNKKIILDILVKSKEIEKEIQQMIFTFIKNFFKYSKDIKINELQELLSLKNTETKK